MCEKVAFARRPTLFWIVRTMEEVFDGELLRSEPEFITFREPNNQFQGTNSARLCSLAGRYDIPIPTRFLAQ
jgi:hypothetical protein